MRSILDSVALGTVHWAEVHDPTVVESDHYLEQEVCVSAGHVQVQMHIMDWAKAQREDPALSAVLDWLGGAEEDRFEGTSGKPCLQQGRETDPVKSTEFYNLSGSLILVLDAQGQDQRSATICSPKGSSSHHPKQVP